MSDEDLLIGGKDAPAETKTPQGSTGIQVPQDLVKVSVFGVFKDQKLNSETNQLEDEYVEQVFPISKPRNEPDENVAQFVWQAKFLPQMALRAVGSAGEINFYPFDKFKRFVFRVGTVVGVTL